MNLYRLMGWHPMNEAAPAEAPAATAAAEPAPIVGMLGGEQSAAAPAEVTAEVTTEQPAEQPAEAKAEADKVEAPGAPEAYADFTAPEGIELNPEVMPALKDVFKDLNLPQDKAQEVLGKLLDIQQKAYGSDEQQAEAMNQQIAQLNQDLAAQCKALPDIGGEHFEQSLELCGKFMAKFATPELRELINYTAVASHPAFFKFVHAVASSMSSDTFEHGGAPVGGQMALANKLWPGLS